MFTLLYHWVFCENVISPLELFGVTVEEAEKVAPESSIAVTLRRSAGKVIVPLALPAPIKDWATDPSTLTVNLLSRLLVPDAGVRLPALLTACTGLGASVNRATTNISPIKNLCPNVFFIFTFLYCGFLPFHTITLTDIGQRKYPCFSSYEKPDDGILNFGGEIAIKCFAPVVRPDDARWYGYSSRAINEEPFESCEQARSLEKQKPPTRGDFSFSNGGPDRIRTGDLLRDREA